VYKVTATIKNNGTVAGHEVTPVTRIHFKRLTAFPKCPQLYISPPASAKSPPYLLKGFDSIFLLPGQSKTVTFNLSRYDLSVWDVIAQRWKVPSGITSVSVGASSRDLRLKGTIVL
jgi:beta-glucosidase